MPELLALNAALALIENLLPIIAAKVAAGEITPEQQAEVRRKYLALKTQADAAFTGPEWES